MKSNKNKFHGFIESLDHKNKILAVTDTVCGVLPAAVKERGTLRVYMQALCGHLQSDEDRDLLINHVKELQKSRRSKKVCFDFVTYRDQFRKVAA